MSEYIGIVIFFALSGMVTGAFILLASVCGPKKPSVVIDWLNAGSREGNPSLLAMFKEGFAALGWKEGVQIVVEKRVTDRRDSSRMTERA